MGYLTCRPHRKVARSPTSELQSISSSGYSAAPKNQEGGVEAWITLAIGACIVVIMTGLSAAMPSPAARSKESGVGVGTGDEESDQAAVAARGHRRSEQKWPHCVRGLIPANSMIRRKRRTQWVASGCNSPASLLRGEPNPSVIIYATPNTAFRSLRSVAASRSNRLISEPTAAERIRSEASRPSLRNSCLRCCSVSPETFPPRRSDCSCAINSAAAVIRPS